MSRRVGMHGRREDLRQEVDEDADFRGEPPASGRLARRASREHRKHHGEAEDAEPGARVSAVQVLAHVPRNETGAAIVPWNQQPGPPLSGV
jgi:hypothetical protein